MLRKHPLILLTARLSVLINAGVTMGEIMSAGIRNVILASGTLSPLSSWSGRNKLNNVIFGPFFFDSLLLINAPYLVELGIPFQVQLENAHVISQSQVGGVAFVRIGARFNGLMRAALEIV